MKKYIILLTVSLLFAYNGYCTEVDKPIKYIYCSISTATSMSFNRMTNISIDYGEKTDLFERNRLVDSSGELREFNSFVDALNWLGDIGWEVVQNYQVQNSEGKIFNRWLLKKNVTDMSEEDREEFDVLMSTKRNTLQ